MTKSFVQRGGAAKRAKPNKKKEKRCETLLARYRQLQSGEKCSIFFVRAVLI